jgi:ribonucleotide reductase alpha subunit
MYVIKRSGAKEAIAFDKISKRLKKCCKEIQTVEINTTKFALRVIEQLHDNITTQKIDEITADLAASMSSQHYDYNTLAGRIIISNMHKSTPTTFSKSVKKLYQYVDKHGKACPLVSAEYYQTVMAHTKVLDALCGDCSRDYLIDYFGYKTLEKAYLMRVNGVVVERPQYMWMRVAVALHMGTVVKSTDGKGTDGKITDGTITFDLMVPENSDAILERIRETYEMLSSKHFIMATPTLFNIGTPRPQCSSCFLVAMEDDSVDGIFSTLTDCARISKYAGGIGLHIHNIRATGSHINGTNGTSDGIVPMLRMFNQTARYINQSGKRNGSFAIYLEPWHADVEMFLQMKTNHGDEELKARDLFYAMWIPDLFMERVKSEGQWTLMCPDECRGLADVYGDEFRTLYESYEKAGKGRITMPARDLWLKILDAQMETGTPYLLYKDAANRKSNQKNLGTIKSSNLCVAPETLVLTERGNLPIQSLCGNRVRVWNGKEYSLVDVVQTGKQQPLIEVKLDDAKVLHCTPYHKFYIQDDVTDEVRTVEAQNLQTGDKIATCDYPEGDYTTPHTIQRIADVVDHGRIDDTYCFTEPLRHAGIFNGIYTSQCVEVVQYSDKNETAVCNLSSVALPAFVDSTDASTPTFDFAKLHKVTRQVTYNLNRVIDINYYPTEKARRSNMRHRPIGIGIQGLADVFMMMGMPFGDAESKTLNREIFETMYHAALTESCELAKQYGAYETFEGSPASEGLLQYDLWDTTPILPFRYDWDGLKNDICKYGLRNSLLMAPMPTASTSQILGYNECIEPITSNIYSRRTLAGEFIVANKYLMRDLLKHGLWNDQMKNAIVANNGSIQGMTEIPAEIRHLYRTVWEIPMRALIDMAADRGVYVCQSQSLNLWMEDPNYKTLTAMHFYSWSKGLKSGIYYLRRQARSKAQQFTIVPDKRKNAEEDASNTTPSAEDGGCEMCSA